MPIVEIKGTGQRVQFPDDMTPEQMRQALARRFRVGDYGEALRPMEKQYKPRDESLTEKMRRGIAEYLMGQGIIDNNQEAYRVGDNLASIVGVAPVVGEAQDISDFNQAMNAGDTTGMLLAGAGVLPFVGDAAKGLYKAHNITEAGLRKADELGGLPVPSLAVADNTKGFEPYGDITLVGDKQSFSKDPTFAADIYSARFPRAKNKVSFKELNKEQARVSENMPSEFGSVSSDFYEERISEDPDRLADSLPNKVKFLESQGIRVTPDQFMSVPEPAKEPAKAFVDLFPEYYGENRKILNLRTKQNPEFRAKAQKLLGDLGMADSDMFENGAITDNGVVEVMRWLRQDRDMSMPKEATFDRGAARDFVDEKVKERSEAFNKYIAGQKSRIVKGKVFSVWNPDTATSKDLAFNLNNAVKLMKSKNPRNQEGFNYGVGNIRANVAPKLNSISEIINRRGQIVSDDEMIGVKQSFDDEFEYLEPELRKAWAYDSEPSLSDIADGLSEYAQGKTQDFNMSDELHEEVQEFFKNLADAPTNYFEIKPQRAVDVSEFYGAAVPKGTSKDIIDQLESKGLQIETYEPSKRQEAIERLNKKSGGAILFSGAGAAILYSQAEDDDGVKYE